MGKLSQIFSNMGAPWTLTALAEDWSNNVGGPVSGISGNADLTRSEVDRYWEGDAASAYLDTLPAQRIAMEKIQTTFSVPMSNALNEMRGAIRTFWIALALALVALAGGIYGAVTASGTIVGIPAGVVAAVLAVVVFLGAIAAGYLNLKSTAEGQNITLIQKLNDNTGFQGVGEHVVWPRSTIEDQQ